MPKYFYKCSSCGIVDSFYHEMSQTMADCVACGAKDSLIKKPSFFNSQTHEQDNKKVGDLVKLSIQEFNEDLAQQKEDLKNEFIPENE